MCCSPQSCTPPSQHTIVEAQAVRRLPAFCILLQVFLPQDCPVWPLHLLQCHLASRIWWQVLLGLQGVKTPQSHHPLPLLLVSCLIVRALCVCVSQRGDWPHGLWPYLVLPRTYLVMSECMRTAWGLCWKEYSCVLLLVCCSCAAEVCASSPLCLLSGCLSVTCIFRCASVWGFECVDKTVTSACLSNDYTSINCVPLPNTHCLLQTSWSGT
jgi:hypothetical protein